MNVHLPLSLTEFVPTAPARLILAAILGGVIGLEREIKRKPAGLRTNMFISIGAAMFTILSDRLAAQFGGDHTRIAAQIIPGIGFIGAGSILHSSGSVTGLTTAATLFVVASIGMAVGGGQYLAAIFATVAILIALYFLGWFEAYSNLKPLLMNYAVRAGNLEDVMLAINGILQEDHRIMQAEQVGRLDRDVRVQFSVEGTLSEHGMLMRRFRASPILRGMECARCPETE